MRTTTQSIASKFKKLLWASAILLTTQAARIIPIENSSLFGEPEVVFVSGGKYMMGSDKSAQVEAPAHQVSVRNFYIAKYEVSNAEFITFLNAEKNHLRITEESEIFYDDLKIASLKCEHACLGWKPEIIYQDGHFKVIKGRESYPVVLVSWFGAQKYADWLARVSGRPYHLPTEEEWEYAAGEGKRHLKWAGVSKIARLNEYANLCDDGCLIEDWRYKNLHDGFPGRAPVGSFKPNAFGIYDMTGNVSEWCGESFYVYTTQKEGALTIPDPYQHTIRGGSWLNSPRGATTTARFTAHAEQCDVSVGFRLARSISSQAPATITNQTGSTAQSGSGSL